MKSLLPVLLLSATFVLPSAAGILTGITTDNQLVTFDSSNPSTFLSAVPINGLVDPLAHIVNLAYHAGDGRFYGIDSNANIYQVSSDGSSTLLNDTFAPTGYSGGLAFDPFTGELAFGTIAGENFSISTDGDVSSSPSFFYAPGDANEANIPSVFAIGIDPAFGEAFFLDDATGTLAQSYDPELGELFTIGSLGLSVTSFGALTIDEEGHLFAALSEDALTSALYSIDKTSGAASLIGNLPVGLSALTIPEPTTSLLGLLGAVLLVRRRRA